MNSHRFDICHYPDYFTNVSLHFNENGHTPRDFSFAPIDKVETEWPRLLKDLPFNIRVISRGLI